MSAKFVVKWAGDAGSEGPREIRIGLRGMRGEKGDPGDDGPPGPAGDPTYGGIFGPYQINAQPGLFADDIGAGPVGTQGNLSINHRDSSGTSFPLGQFAQGVAPGGLFQVWWSGGRRVYRRIAGFGSNEFDLVNGITYSLPVELVYSTAVLPASGTAVRVTALSSPTPGFASEAADRMVVTSASGNFTTNGFVKVDGNKGAFFNGTPIEKEAFTGDLSNDITEACAAIQDIRQKLINLGLVEDQRA